MAVIDFSRPVDPIAEVRRHLEAANPSWGNRQALTCACCGQRYPRGQWTCCAPPGGMSMANWLPRWCEHCPTAGAAKGPGQRRCPHHCGCHREPENNLPFDPSEPVAQVIDRARQPKTARTSSLPMEDEDAVSCSDDRR
jgi:hypothetical protein